MSTLLTPDEFVFRAVGIPWVRWRADWNGCDCYGLIVMYLREVLGIDLGEVPQTSVAEGFAGASGWEECGAEAGATAWMSWRNSVPTHCGVVLDGGRLLHCEGEQDRPGSVRITRMSAMKHFFPDLRFYRRTAC